MEHVVRVCMYIRILLLRIERDVKTPRDYVGLQSHLLLLTSLHTVCMERKTHTLAQDGIYIPLMQSVSLSTKASYAHRHAISWKLFMWALFQT